MQYSIKITGKNFSKETNGKGLKQMLENGEKIIKEM